MNEMKIFRKSFFKKATLIKQYYFSIIFVPIVLFYYQQSIFKSSGIPITAKLMLFNLFFPGLTLAMYLWAINWTKKQKQCENCFYLSKPEATSCDRCNHPHNLNAPIKNPLHEKYPSKIKRRLIFAGIFLLLFELLSNYQEKTTKEKSSFWNKIHTTAGDAPDQNRETVEDLFESTESNP